MRICDLCLLGSAQAEVVFGHPAAYGHLLGVAYLHDQELTRLGYGRTKN